MDSVCLISKQPWFSDGSCLSVALLRKIMKMLYRFAPDAEKSDFRPYSRFAGRDHTHDHRKKPGLHTTISETFDNLPETLWSVPDLKPKNTYLHEMIIQQPGEQESFAEVLRKHYFKPVLFPPFESILLKSEDIQDAVTSIMTSNRGFGFLGVHRPNPVSTNSMLSLLKKLWKRKRSHGKARSPLPFYKSFGVVWNTVNTDTGSHWVVALFFPYKKEYEYFDSLGGKPNTLVEAQIRKLKREMAKLAGFASVEWKQPPFVKRQHQRSSTQCGMYVIWYIVSRIILNKSYAKIQSLETNDATVCAERRRYFRKAEPQLVRYMRKQQAVLAKTKKKEEEENSPSSDEYEHIDLTGKKAVLNEDSDDTDTDEIEIIDVPHESSKPVPITGKNACDYYLEYPSSAIDIRRRWTQFLSRARRLVRDDLRISETSHELVSSETLFTLFEILDKIYFDNSLAKLLLSTGHRLEIKWKETFERVGNAAETWSHPNGDINIYFNYSLYHSLFRNRRHKFYENHGVPCDTTLECLLNTMCHEIIHVILMAFCVEEAHSEGGHGPTFRNFAKNLFGQYHYQHRLIPRVQDENKIQIDDDLEHDAKLAIEKKYKRNPEHIFYVYDNDFRAFAIKIRSLHSDYVKIYKTKGFAETKLKYSRILLSNPNRTVVRVD